MKIERIVSGGQTGADRAGLDAAKALGIPTGGTAPKGWRICLPDGSDGTDPTLAELGLVEHRSREYPPRTRQNVADSDGTVWFGYAESPGGKLTITTCKELGKPCLADPVRIGEFLDWLKENNIRVLNVAGNRTSEFNPDIYDRVFEFLLVALT